MPRKPRKFVDGGYYHLIARGNNRLFILEDVRGYEVFKDLLKTSKEKYDWRLHHYCLMGNHIHLLGNVKIGITLPRIMQYLLFEYSRWYRKKTKYVGHLWQGRYKSPLIESESYFLECGRYIERNPVRAKLVKEAGAYRWSSYNHYAFGKQDELIDDDPYYQGLGRSSSERQKHYREYVALDGPYDGLVDKVLKEEYF